MRLTKHIIGGFAAMSILAACGGGGGSSSSVVPTPTGDTPPTAPPTNPTPTKPYTELDTREEAARFLMMAGFGGTDAEIDALVGTDATDWIVNEMRKPATLTLPAMRARYLERTDTNRHHSDMLWQNLLTADDELRQRMFYALSQIFVVSDSDFFDQGYATAAYTDILTENAFGNYRDMIDEITYNPTMGRYLTYFRNPKGDPETGRMPDENYAREILQLFSIGLVELNLDGTPKAGSPETYTNDDIIGLARVFTGFLGDGPDDKYRNMYEDWRHRPMQMWEGQHSDLEKSFLGTTIPENTDGVTSVDTALDTIANHPNVAPFLSRQLIQRFTASSPSPEYVERVATVWNAGRYTAPNGQAFGSGTKGDFQAVIAAILLDESVHDDIQEPNEGKVREPILKFVQYARAFDVSDINVFEEWRLRDTRSPYDRLGQHILRSPSVFNFYRPGYLAPGTETGDAGLTAPEFQVANGSSALGFINYLTHFVMKRPDRPDDYPTFQPDFTTEISLADDPEALVDHLSVKLTAGQLSEAAKTDIIDAVTTKAIEGDDLDADRLKRVQIAVLMTIGSPAYAVQN